MFCCKKPNETIESMASLLILGGVVPLAGVMLLQYVLHYFPCHFCLLQRYPYVPVILAGAASLAVKRGGRRWQICVAVGLLGLLTTGGLGIVHTGIEQGWIHYSGGCVAQPVEGDSLEALRAAITRAPLVACNEVTAKFLGLSLATWNAIWAFAVAFLIVLQYRFDRKHHG